MMKRALPVIIVIALLLAIGGSYAYKYYTDKYSYSSERIDLYEYFGVTKDSDVTVVLNDEFSEIKARRLDGTDYLAYTDVCDIISNRFYYGEEDNVLLYVLPDSIVRNEIGSDTFTDSLGNVTKQDAPITLMEGSGLYISLEYLARFVNFEWESFEDPAYIWIKNEWNRKTTAAAVKDTHIRYRGGIKSEIVSDVSEGDRLVVLEEMDTWARVMDKSAHIGYVELKHLGEFRDDTPIPREDAPKDEDYKSIHRDHRINMGFHAIAGTAGNDTLDSCVDGTKGLNVIAPTWFSLSDSEGTLTDFGSEKYVERAHAMGLEVWGVVDNFNGPASMEDFCGIIAHEQGRAYLIEELKERALAYSLDGINVDFENVPESVSRSYVEFLRELSVMCREQGLVLSVDNYVPLGFNQYYDLAEQGVMVDYVVIMCYDEHYAGSPEAGSVASISYVDNGIGATVRMVPAEKVIGAIPFYTRIWRTSKDGSVSSEAVTMIIASEFIQNHSLDMVWDEETCQNYGEYTDNEGKLVQLWMEDAQSLQTKLNVMFGYGISGVAQWELGYETKDVWPLIESFINGR